jgi:hypothetical protein
VNAQSKARLVRLIVFLVASAWTFGAVAQTSATGATGVSGVTGPALRGNAMVEPQRDASRFAWQYGHEAGGSTLHNPYGGQYVYSQTDLPDGRLPQLLILGKAVRDEYVLFSAQEEEALWKLREQLLREREPAPPVRHHAEHRRRLALDWPKVVVDGDETCVPESAFADSADWRGHLLCWLGGARLLRNESR